MLVPIIVGQLIEGADEAGADIVDQHVDPPVETFERRGDSFRDAFRGRKVAEAYAHVGAARLDFGGQLIEFALVDVDQSEPATFLREGERGQRALFLTRPR